MEKDPVFPLQDLSWTGGNSATHEASSWGCVRSLAWCCREDAAALIRGLWRMLRLNRWKVLCLLLGGAGLILHMFPYDLEWLAFIRQDAPTAEGAQLRAAAQSLSYWGDFAGFNTIIFVTLGCFAFVRRSPFFRRMTMAAVLGTLLTGGLANVLRVSTGRARPASHLVPGFHGPSLSAKKHSFPSAHTATAFGMSVPVALAFPPAGVPMLLVSSGVAWSRMQNNCHHPSDVVTSILLSALFGVPLGLMVRRSRSGSRRSA